MYEDIEEDAVIEAERKVEQAYKALNTAVEVLEHQLDALRKQSGAMTPADAEAVVKEMKAVNAAFLWAMQQEGKARDAGSQRYGRRGGGQLDLGAARDEIGRRLACLRAAGAGGALSEGPE